MGDRPLPGELARRVRVVVLDVDGVFTDNGIYLGETANGERVELKRFDIMDGLGVRMLGWAGLRVVLVSGRESPATAIRAAELGVESRQVAGGYKLGLVEEILAESGVGWEALAVLGDDLADLPLLARAGLAATVPNGAVELKAEADWIALRPGGSGAVREFAEALLHARGEWRALVEAYRSSRERGGAVRDFLERQ